MYLKRATISNFKNIREADITFASGINCITGANGSGKTNLLDAVYYLSMTKSYFSGADHFPIHHDESCFSITGVYSREDGTEERVSVALDRSGEKLAKRNDKRYQRLSDHIGLLPVVMISPFDTSLVNESGEERRRFLNLILSQIDMEYLRKMQNYNLLLSQRNKLLKSSYINGELLDTFAERLSANASYIYEKRKEFVERFRPAVSKYYEMVSGRRERIDITYKSDMERGDMVELLRCCAERDRLLKHTSAGIHRDDLLLTMKGYPVRSCGSQGQQKSFLVALKLAQFELMRDFYDKTPLLLLDDIFDKLDMERVGSLMDIVSSDFFGQIFITDNNRVRAESVLAMTKKCFSIFGIEEGEIL